MRAAVLEAFNEPLKIWNDWKDPDVGPDHVLVKVMANGICRSDWHLWQGHWDWMGFSSPLPAVLGHETAGIVEEVGSNVKRFKIRRSGCLSVWPGLRHLPDLLRRSPAHLR